MLSLLSFSWMWGTLWSVVVGVVALTAALAVYIKLSVAGLRQQRFKMPKAKASSATAARRSLMGSRPWPSGPR